MWPINLKDKMNDNKTKILMNYWPQNNTLYSLGLKDKDFTD